MEGLVDPRLFESRTGFLVGVALLVLLFAAIAAWALSEELARRRERAAERAAGSVEEKEQSGRAA